VKPNRENMKCSKGGWQFMFENTSVGQICCQPFTSSWLTLAMHQCSAAAEVIEKVVVECSIGPAALA